jgi:DNA replication protein DnaC
MSLVTERIQQHCKRLKLIYLANEWPAIADSSPKGQDSLADFVDKLLGAECAAREQRTREAMLKLATLPSIKTLEGYDFAFASGAPRKQITELGGLAFIERHENIVLLGPTEHAS